MTGKTTHDYQNEKKKFTELNSIEDLPYAQRMAFEMVLLEIKREAREKFTKEINELVIRIEEELIPEKKELPKAPD